MEIYLGLPSGDGLLRKRVYSGALTLVSKLTSSGALCDHAIECAANAFGHPEDLRRVHKSMDVREFARVVTGLKHCFTNSQQSKAIIRAFISEIGEDPGDYLFDVPRIRVAPTYTYLHSGVSYTYRPHRDTWYGGPACQINTWMPLFPITPDQTMMINPSYFNRPVENTSKEWSLREWVTNQRPNAADNIEEEKRAHPVPLEEIDNAGEVRLAGQREDMVIFSGSHLHGTVPNMTDQIRYSVDFRIMHIDDLRAGRGAVNVDSLCADVDAGFTDYFRGSDFARYGDFTR